MLRHISSPLRLYSGAGCLDRFDQERQRVGAERIALLTSPSLLNTDALARTVHAIGDAFLTVLPDVRRQSPRADVEKLAARLSELRVDGIAVLGGGSAMVTARAAVIAMAEDRPLKALCSFRDEEGRLCSPRLIQKKIPIFVVPTTPTTAMAKPAAAVLDQDKRLSLFDPQTRPQAIFLDPECLATAPETLVLSSAANTFVSAIEGLLQCRDPLAEADLRQALRLLGPDRSRLDLAIAAILTARGTDHTGLGLATALSHALASVCGIDGGAAKAVLLPHVAKAIDPASQRRLNDLLDGRSLSDAMSWLKPSRDLRELGFKPEDAALVLKHARRDWFFRDADQDIEVILKAAAD